MDVPGWGKQHDRHNDHVKFQIFQSRKISIQKGSFRCWYHDSSKLCEHVKTLMVMYSNISTVCMHTIMTHGLQFFLQLLFCKKAPRNAEYTEFFLDFP